MLLDLQRGIRRMPSCLYFSVDIEKWGILLEADSSHPLAFDVEKKTHTKTKQNLTHVKCCSWDMKSFSPTYCVGCCSEDIATSQDVPEKKNIIGCFLNFQCHDTSFL